MIVRLTLWLADTEGRVALILTHRRDHSVSSKFSTEPIFLHEDGSVFFILVEFAGGLGVSGAWRLRLF